MRECRDWGRNTFLVDREPSTTHEAITLADRKGDPLPGTVLRCEGFHAYGEVAMHHAYLALARYEAALEHHHEHHHVNVERQV